MGCLSVILGLSTAFWGFLTFGILCFARGETVVLSIVAIIFLIHLVPLILGFKKYRNSAYGRNDMKKPIYKRFWFWLIIVGIILGCVLIGFEDVGNVDNDSSNTTQTEKETKPKKSGWRADLSPELVAEIEAAFTEIGENPDNIISIEYIDIHTSGYVFEQKCYKVEFDWSLGNPGYKHSRYYRIVTQNYYDGEPEKEQYPNEFLCTIKYWAGDDGHGTNVNQWSWTGNGKKQ